MDRNYKSRIAYRRTILREYPDNTCAATSDHRIDAAVREYYIWLTGTYLPLRYPSMFKLHKTTYEVGEHFLLQNLITGEMWPSFPLAPESKAKILLSTLAKTLDEDLLFLLPEETDEQSTQDAEPAKAPRYVLHAYGAVCLSGFNLTEKINKPLSAIHGPVPGYAAKLENSMDRFFATLKPGKYVKRANWSITTHGELYAAPRAGVKTHAKDGESPEQEIEIGGIDGASTFLRVERQTVHKLPLSAGVVFAFKTYLTSLEEVRAEGRGEELAAAVDGLREGNVPAMHVYKRGAVWGEAVKAYLRGEDGGVGSQGKEGNGVRKRKG
jgi:hypothetical protein